MLDLNFVRQNLDLVEKKITSKGVSFNSATFLALDEKRRGLITAAESIKSKRKAISKEIGLLRRKGERTDELEAGSIALARELEALDLQLNEVENEFNALWLNLPNLPDDSVPFGKDATDNQVVRQWGEKPEFGFVPKPHWELGSEIGRLDFPRAAKIAGARFAVYFGTLARLERVLIQFMLDLHTREHGYLEVLPPFLANTDSLVGTGNLPKFKGDLFKVEDQDYYLIPTAEVPLTNLHRDEALSSADLPLNYVAYTPCFRSEAGSYGKDVRGIIRNHQFNKVELLKFTAPERSQSELESLTRDAERVLQKLNLHYRVVLLCSGDMSFSSAKTYDIEVWMPSRNAYMEISSCSNFHDFQARRARIRYVDEKGHRTYPHTLNGSGLAVGRTVAAIMENYQTADGGVNVPTVLESCFPDQKRLV
ncbi:MAG: serine--tRNA ligase [Acidobacteriota bacterium]|jgi:seryl-tRNA synthetase|nr:serine--tRNA ligase [Acidobacteriota bacterium]